MGLSRRQPIRGVLEGEKTARNAENDSHYGSGGQRVAAMRRPSRAGIPFPEMI
jgi:hypothetical protein